jgi:hypothetical protein
MHSKPFSIAAIAALSLLPIFWTTHAGATEWPDGQEVLIECPVWEWAPSPIAGIEYELCFNDIDHCVAAQIGDSVCIPSLGVHDVWVTAIDYRSGAPVYYDGDIVPIVREMSADFDRNGVVGFADFGLFLQFFGVVSQSFGGASGSPIDLDGDGVGGFSDFGEFVKSFGKCVNASRTVYKPCQ